MLSLVEANPWKAENVDVKIAMKEVTMMKVDMEETASQ